MWWRRTGKVSFPNVCYDLTPGAIQDSKKAIKPMFESKKWCISKYKGKEDAAVVEYIVLFTGTFWGPSICAWIHVAIGKDLMNYV